MKLKPVNVWHFRLTNYLNYLSNPTMLLICFPLIISAQQKGH